MMESDKHEGRAHSPPSFVTKLADVTVSKGRSIVLTCEVSGADSVSWYKDGIIQRNAPDFKQTFDGTVAKLEISEVFMDDYGTYMCAIKNNYAECRCSCKIFVRGSESDDIFAPVFLKKLENQTVEEGDLVTMECDVIGSQPIITWCCDRQTLRIGDKFRMSYDGKTARLLLKSATKGDNGKYECSAENSAGRITCDCLLCVKEPVRRKIHRIYGSVCLLQILFGALMFICGILAIVVREDSGTFGTPYFIFAFLAATLIIGAGLCTMYIFYTKSAITEPSKLTENVSNRRRLANVGNQVLSVFSIAACLLGGFACGMFAFRKCDSTTWWSICEFTTKQLENKVISTVLLVFLGISAIISFYSLIMSCSYAWVFAKSHEKRKPEVPMAAGFPEVFTNAGDNMMDTSMQEADTERKQSYADDSESEIVHEDIPDPETEGLLSNEQVHEPARLRHLQMQQTTNYVDVLNDPAMKLKLKERSSKLK